MYNETQLLTVHYTTLLSALHIRSLQFVQAYNLQISPPWFMWSIIQQMQNTFPAVTFQLHYLWNMYTMQSTWIYFIGVFFHRLQACQDNATIYALYSYKDKRYNTTVNDCTLTAAHQYDTDQFHDQTNRCWVLTFPCERIHTQFVNSNE